CEAAPDRDLRPLARAPRLSRTPEDYPARRGQAVERPRWLHELPSPPLGQRAAARRVRRVGHARGSYVPARGLRDLPERTRVRRRAPRATRAATAARGVVRIRLREGGRLRGRRLPRRSCGGG